MKSNSKPARSAKSKTPMKPMRKLADGGRTPPAPRPPKPPAKPAEGKRPPYVGFAVGEAAKALRGRKKKIDDYLDNL